MTTPAWAHYFDNSPRHCFENNLGVRWLQHELDTECHEDHTLNPKVVGQTEWLRFIREFGVEVDSSPFTSDGYRLLIESDGHPTSQGQIIYCETYLREHPQDWGLDPVFRVFLDNEESFARIECYDPSLVDACERALLAVERSYAA